MSNRAIINLNDLEMDSADEGGIALQDYSTCDEDTTVYFRNIKMALIRFILGSQAVIGCVAWLTDLDVLAALAKRACSIIVQKEDFLRPDIGGYSKRKLREAYGKLGGLDRFNVPGALYCMSSSSDPTIQGVRCVGNHNANKASTKPRMHNKFIVSCDVEDHYESDGNVCTERVLRPIAVWTGSFNFTNNGTCSLENAIMIRREKIADAYQREWSQIAALSEPLDWKTEWCEPEWRFGT